uniref:Nuclear pore complex protein n=1 Tax=Eptatretus burgeri TaxID=7764 RepID=A0A8C4Q5U9_EPTBU
MMTKCVADSPLFDISDIIGSSGRPSRLTETPFLRTPLARANETTQDEWLSKLEFFTPDKSGHPQDVSTSQIISENIPPSSFMLLDDDDEDEVAASKSLYVEFLEILRKHPSSEVFELIEEYEAVCSKQLEILKKRTAMSVRIQKKTMSVLWLLNQEMITWRLIRSLYSDRVQSALEDENALAVDEFVSGPSEKRVMEALFRRDAITRQSQLVVDWLESVAKNEIDNYLGKIRYSCDSVCWENTLHLLNQSKSFGSFLNTRIVTELDPDAPIRQKLHLAEQDREDEANLLKHTFDLIRAGMVDEAQRHCKHCGQAWRAATLEGWRLYHDPNYDGVPSSGELQPIEGNFYRDVWKRCCWRMAEEEQFNRYERAIYATLSGNLKQLLLACVSWEDHLWAYFRVMVDGLVEQEVRSLTIRTRELEDLPQEMTPIELTAEKIFEEIQATNLALLKESKEHFHVLQKHVILGDVDGLMQEFGTWLTQSEVVLPSHLLRCMAHMVLFLRSLGLETKENISLEVIKAYVELLVREKHTGLVAFYARHLPPEHAAVAYAAFLEGITETEERKLCLQLAEQAGLDVMAVTKLVVENIRRADPVGFVHHDSSPILNSATSVDDLSMIDAIEWLIFEPNHRAEAIKQSNAIMRALLASKKHEAAKALFERIPGDSIDVIHRLWEEQSMEVPLPQETDRAIREHLCIHTYLVTRFLPPELSSGMFPRDLTSLLTR